MGSAQFRDEGPHPRFPETEGQQRFRGVPGDTAVRRGNGSTGTAAGSQFGWQFAAQFQDEPLGGAFPDAGRGGQHRGVTVDERAGRQVDGQRRQQRQAEPRTDTAHGDEVPEQRQLVPAPEAVQREQVFLHDEVRVEAHGLPLPERSQGAARGEHFHSEQARAQHGARFPYFRYLAFDESDHGRTVSGRPERYRTAGGRPARRGAEKSWQSRSIGTMIARVIEVTDLTKKFGDVTAVDAVSFSVPAGQVFGLLGPNGAGKTTTLRMLATLIRPSAGSARVTGLGLRDDPAAVRRNIGVVNGGMGLYDRLTGREILRYFGRLYDMTDARIRERIAALDAVLDLKATLDRQAGGFSTGMKQKIVIARAVLHDPPVIFFDEASSGLDVMARRALLDFVRNYPGTDRAVIYSTHVMTEVEELCDRLAIMSEGRLVAEGTVASLAEQTGADSLEGAFFRLVRPEAVA